MPTLAERLGAIVEALPNDGAVTLSTATLRAWLADAPRVITPPAPIAEPDAQGWRERLWTCPADTRLGVRELASALDRSPDWVYRATNAKLSAERGRDPLPCKRLDGVLVFTADAVRAWLRASEAVVNPERGGGRTIGRIGGRHA